MSVKPVAAGSINGTASSGKAAAKARVRWVSWLPKPQMALMPYSLSCPEVADYAPGQVTRDLIDSDAWREVMRPLFQEMDCQRLERDREAPLYSSEELESVLLYQRVCGKITVKEGRGLLAGDEPQALEARRFLGLDQPRNNGRCRGIKGKPVERRDGVPSEASLCRHKERFGEEPRAAAYEQLFARLRDEHVKMPEFQAEIRELAIDGSHLFVRRTAPIYDAKTGKLVNGDQVTLPDGGFAPKSMGEHKTGHGWNLVTLAPLSGVPLSYDLPKLPADEKGTGTKLIEEFIADVLPKLPAEQIGVLTCDSNFQSPHIRAAARRARLLENIHFASHGKSKESIRNAKTRNKKIFQIEGYPNWTANGHREIKCRCGRWASKRCKILGNGSLSVRLEGQCPSCGSITVTSGDWRNAQNPDRFVRCMPDEEVEDREWALGNPLTYNNPEAKAYGVARFSRNENLHSILKTRFKVLEERRWLRNHAQARADVAIVYSIIHWISMEQRRRARATTTLRAAA